MSDHVDYKALFLREEEKRRRAEERERQAVEEKRQAEERERQAEERERHEQERNQQTTFKEFVQNCHHLLSGSLSVGDTRDSTKGKIPIPTGKYCPLYLKKWTDCSSILQDIYNSVCHYLQPNHSDAPRLFIPISDLTRLAQRLETPICSEKDLEYYERLAVADHVHMIISELCKIPQARDEFQLRDGVRFDNQAHNLDEEDTTQPGSTRCSPHHYCIRRVEGSTQALITTVEYKPPHKLPYEVLKLALNPDPADDCHIDFYDDIVKSNSTPVQDPEKSRFKAMRLVGSAIVQEFHVMIQEGLEYSYLTTGLGLVQLWIPSDDPRTLYYDLSKPSLSPGGSTGPETEIEKVLCLCLVSCRSQIRNHTWRNNARNLLPTWETSFSRARSQISPGEVPQNPLDPDYTSSETDEKSASEFQPSSSPAPATPNQEIRKRSRSGCAPSSVFGRGSPDDTDPNLGPTTRKRGFSQVTSSPPTQQSTSDSRTNQTSSHGGQTRPHINRFCTQQCLLGLQQGGILDSHCPNVAIHHAGKDDNRHQISAQALVLMLKQQLDRNLDEDCTPMGECGSYGASFKITCTKYGYTIVGKGTTSRLWKEVSREADVYRVLQPLQGSAVPVFLGKIDLGLVYFLHGTGDIRHMLLMGWGGKTVQNKQDETIRSAISRSVREIHSLGVQHGDLRPRNILWNEELNRALIIDFHRSTLYNRQKRLQSHKRQYDIENRSFKRVCEQVENLDPTVASMKFLEKFVQAASEAKKEYFMTLSVL
ncbi:hypothetical protein LOZ51_005944 [Ophidiomyces ophidiicola]|nr:hypothetical protein LOZ55_004996 [Ophidiomyces ophidiicola]KAI1986783.1 hypothetical protein LOZ51_005944 [Ophidiomyces ophidiicola]